MTIETTLNYEKLDSNQTQHFSGVYAGQYDFIGSLHTHYINGVVQEISLGVLIDGHAVNRPNDRKLAIGVTRKTINRMGELGQVTIDAHYTGSINPEDPSPDVLKTFFDNVGPSIDSELEKKNADSSIRFGLAAKLYRQ